MNKIKKQKKLNNQGFTIIELTLSFVFVFTLAFSMFQLLFNYRVKENEESTKSQMIDYKNQITLAIQNDISEKILRNIDYCTNGGRVIDRCLILHFNDGTSKQLAVETGKKTIDGEDYDINYISYGGVIYESSDAPLMDFRADYMLYHNYDSDKIEDKNINVYRISIPIYHYDLDGNYGIDITAVGYNYAYKETGGSIVTGSTIQTPPDALQTNQGRIYNGYVTSTSKIVGGMNNQTILVRVKFDTAKLATFQQIFGNWQMAGSGISLASRSAQSNKMPCFGAQVSNSSAFSSAYTEVCSNTAISDGNWHTIVGTFDSSNKTMKLYVDGVEKGSKTDLAANSQIDASKLPFAIGGNMGYISNNNLFYGTISHAIVYNRTLNATTISKCLTASNVDTSCVKSNDANIKDNNKILDEELVIE